MAGTVYSFVNSEFKVRWREPYITEGLNAKLNAIIPPGVYRGFVLGTSAAPYCISINQDPTWEDHVAVINTDGYSLTARKSDGDFDVDLTAFNGDSVVLVVEGSYTIGSTTTVRLIAYTLSEWQALSVLEQQKRVPLGLIAVSIAIGVSDISDYYRSPAWKNISAEAFPKKQLVKNSSFEEAGTASSQYNLLKEWTTHNINAAGAHVWAYQSTVVRSGNWSAGITATSTASKPVLLKQDINQPCSVGDRFYSRVYLRRVAAASAGSLDLRFEFTDYAAVPAVTYVSFTIPMNTTDVGWVMFDLHAVAPSGYPLLRSIQLNSAGLTYGAPGSIFYVDDFEVWSYTSDLETVLSPGSDHYAPLWTRALNIGDDLQISTWAKGARFRWNTTNSPNSGDGDLYLDRLNSTDDGSFTGAGEPPRFVAQQLVLGNYNRSIGSSNDRARVDISGPTAPNMPILAEVMRGTSVSNCTRRYASRTGRQYITHNAYWNSTTTKWNKDTLGAAASRLDFNPEGLALYFHANVDNTPWDDTDWSAVSTSSFILGNIELNGATNELRILRNDAYAGAGLTPRVESNNTDTELRDHAFKFGDDARYRQDLWYSRNEPDRLALTRNANWNGATWDKVEAGQAASGLLFYDTYLAWAYTASGTANWASNAWTRTPIKIYGDKNQIDLNDQVVKFLGVTTGAAGSNPSKTTAVSNELRAINLPKAFARIHLISSALTYNGFNVATVTGAAAQVVVTLASAMDHIDDMCPQVTVTQPGTYSHRYTASAIASDTTHISIYVVDNTGAYIDWTSSVDMDVALVVFGRQTT